MTEQDDGVLDIWQAALSVAVSYGLATLYFAVLQVLCPQVGGRAMGVTAQLLSYGTIIAFLMSRGGIGYRRLLHDTRTPARTVAAYLLVPVLLVAGGGAFVAADVVNMLETLLPMSDGNRALFASMLDGSPEALAATLAVAPWAEEMLFRGLILRGLLKYYQPGPAIFLSALLFALAHLNVYQGCVAMLVGLVCGWMYWRTRTLLPCVLAHFTFNAVAMFYDPAPLREAGSRALQAATSYTALAAVLIGLGLLYRILERRKV
ncbi:MAG: CPBP family intramembrane metalloprotease [Rhodocyclaceae bacterium]|nr:CPBP family intramembrane metalloprotease [Rhodocyclaceae bacterium]MBX3670900.1 CPBP family intramembrane metalloprotease [Rhodocyclaceae bacterium]